LTTRQVLADPLVMGTIAVAVFLCGLFLTATPLLFSDLADEALLEAVTAPEPQLRNITASLSSYLGADTPSDPFDRVERRGDSFRDAQMPLSIQPIIDDVAWVVDSPQFVVEAMPGSDARLEFTGSQFARTLLRLRYQQDVDSRVTLLEGSFPQSHDPITVELGADCPLTGLENEEEEVDCRQEVLSVFEIAVTRETLDFFGVEVGGMVLLSPDLDDAAYFGVPQADLQYNLVARVSGIIEIQDPEADFWFNDPRLLRPRVRSNADFTFVFATGLMSPADYGRVLRETGTAHWNYQWRYFVDPDLVRNGDIVALRAELTSFQDEYPASTFLGSDEIGINTKLPSIITRYIERRDTTLAMMSISIAGLFVLTVILILMLSALATERQRSGLLLLRHRGASRVQLAMSRALQGLLLTVPSALLAYFAATRLLPGYSNAPARLSTALVLAATVFFVVAASPVLLKDLGGLQLRDRGVATSPGRRLVFEVSMMVLAIAGTVIVRRRGSVGVTGDLDPLLAVTPVLIAIALGILALRVYPRVISVFASMGSRRRGAVTFVGFRRVLMQPPAVRLSLVVMLVAVAVATLASITRFAINHGQIQSTWLETGAAYRIDEPNPANPLTGDPDLGVVESVEALAFGVRFPVARPSGGSEGVPTAIDLLFLETRNYAAVTAGTPADAHFAPYMTEPLFVGAGTEGDPLPIIASQAWDGQQPAVGENLIVNIGARDVHLVVAEVRESFPGMPGERAFAVADIRHLEGLVSPALSRPTVLYINAPPAAAADLSREVETQTLTGVLTAQSLLFSEVHDDRFAVGLEGSLTAAFWLATVFSVVAALSSLALAAWTRRRDFGYMRTQGLTFRQAGWLTVIEQLPAILFAVVVGSIAGVTAAHVLAPAIDVSAFTGSELDIGMPIDIGPTVLVATGILVGLSLATSIFGYTRRREHLGELLRMGDE
jgi:putative ABC transport system permease protein